MRFPCSIRPCVLICWVRQLITICEDLFITTASVNLLDNRNAQTIVRSLAPLPSRQKPPLPVRTLNTRALKNEFAAAKRGKLTPMRAAVGDNLTGFVVLGTKPITVEQVTGNGKPYAEVFSSRVWSHEPQPLDKPIPRFKPLIFPNQPGKKMCSWCGDWREFKHFSGDKRNRDGLQSQCKFCHAERERKRYWERKLEAEMKQ